MRVFVLVLGLVWTHFYPALSDAQTCSKVFTKSFNTSEKGTVRLELPGSVEVRAWDSPSLKFEISVTLSVNNASLLYDLANAGRYNLVSRIFPGDDIMYVQAPNMNRPVQLKGAVLKEELRYIVYVPLRMSVDLSGMASLPPR